MFGAVCVLFGVLIGRLMYIEYTSGDKYEKIVLAQQRYDSQIIPYQRGDITDRKGTVLATSVDVYNVILDARLMNETVSDAENDEKRAAAQAKVDSTFTHLAECFPEIDIEAAKAYLASDPDSQYKILAKDVSYEEMKAYSDITSDKDTKNEIVKNGIWFEKEYKRSYPYGSLAAQMIGYATDGTNGVIGLESEYNSTLNGVNGRSYGYLESESSVEQTVIEPENGNTLITAIDTNVQSIVEQCILDWNNQNLNGSTTGSKNTAALVMNPKNGEILAMATYPTFDLNDPRNLSAFYTPEELEAMPVEDQLNFLNRLWQCYPVSQTYEPGSTFKPFTISAGLDTGTLSGGETFFCDGGEQIGPNYVRCTSHHGQLTLYGALQHSCNDALMQISGLVGAHNFYTYQHLFGFGQKTGIDLPAEARTDSLLYSEDDLGHTINLATNSFGQNFNVTMVQLAAGFSSIINEGTLYQPHIVTGIEDASGNIVRDISPTVVKKTISAETSATMRDMLRSVVTEGTAKTAAVPGYDIGGKTGTAQKLPRADHKYLVSFIGFAPVSDPEVVVYVVVDEPNVADQAHSTYAQLICKNIMSQILPYLNVEKLDPNSTEGQAAQAAADAAAKTAADQAAAAAAGQEVVTEHN